jgi:hypothetical protein
MYMHTHTHTHTHIPLASLSLPTQSFKKNVCNGIFHETHFPGVLMGSKEQSRHTLYVVISYLPIVLREVDPSTGQVRRWWASLHSHDVGSLASKVKEGAVLRDVHYWNIMTSQVLTIHFQGQGAGLMCFIPALTLTPYHHHRFSRPL